MAWIIECWIVDLTVQSRGGKTRVSLCRWGQRSFGRKEVSGWKILEPLTGAKSRLKNAKSPRRLTEKRHWLNSLLSTTTSHYPDIQNRAWSQATFPTPPHPWAKDRFLPTPPTPRTNHLVSLFALRLTEEFVLPFPHSLYMYPTGRSYLPVEMRPVKSKQWTSGRSKVPNL